MTTKVKKITGLEKEDILQCWTLDEVPESFRDEVWVGWDEDGEKAEEFFVNTETGEVLTSYDGLLTGGYSRLKKMEEE